LSDTSGLPVPPPKQWPYRADPPRRYAHRYATYQQRGGLVRLEEDIAGFTAGGAGQGDISRFYFFCVAFDQLMKEGVRGDTAELGVYKGNTGSLLARMARRMGTTAWLLDTFEGFDPKDLQGIDATHRMEFGDTSLAAVRALVGEDSVRFVKGYFPDSAVQMPPDLRFALVHIDCDLYQPIAHALPYFYQRLLPVGYLIVHDYASLDWDGAERAVDEFFADKPEPVVPLTDGSGSVVIRKAHDRRQGENWLLERRCAALSDDWVRAGADRLRDVLVAGWSGAEPWGVWGVGASHEMALYLRAFPGAPVRLELDVSASLAPARPTQAVTVLAGGQTLATWNFTAAGNRAPRSVVVPLSAIATGEWGAPVIRLEFRPQSVEPVDKLDPSRTDTRALGLGLHRLRHNTGT